MKGLIIFSNGMEDSEALSTTALLRRAGIEMDSATIEENRMVTTGYKQHVVADYDLKGLHVSAYDFLIIPGGGYVNRIIDYDQAIKETILKFNESNKLIGAICAAPRFLGRLGLLDGIYYTAFPGSEKDMPRGVYLKDQKAVTTDRIITARSAGSVIEFVYALVAKLKSEADAKKLLENIVY